MLNGDLHPGAVLEVLDGLGEQRASGCLHLQRCGLVAQEGSVHLRSGEVYAAGAGSERFPLAVRLVSVHGLSPDVLQLALRTKARDLPQWRLGAILVHLGDLPAETLDAAHREQLLDALTDLADWDEGVWRFDPEGADQPMLHVALPVGQAHAEVQRRQREWARLLPAVLGAHAVAERSTNTDPPGASEAARRVLPVIDGVRTLAEIGHARGLSALESARALAELIGSGAVSMRAIDPSAVGGSVLDLLASLSDTDDTADAGGDPHRQEGPGGESSGLGGPTQVAAVVDLSAARATRAAEEAVRTAARHEAQAQDLALAASMVAAAQPDLGHAPTLDTRQESLAQALSAALDQGDSEADLDDGFESDLDADRDIDLEPAAAYEEPCDPDAELTPQDNEPSEPPEPPEPPAEPAGQLPSLMRHAETDTASLLRELSSLGLNDEPTHTASPRVARPPGWVDPRIASRKKKGLFGR
jgi:hypothetical protein